MSTRRKLYSLGIRLTGSGWCLDKGLFTWREEDLRTRKILEGETTFRLVYMQKFQSGWLLEIK